jgi:hypothetical protein
MIPYKTLFQPDAEFSFVERTFHREMNGGYERWIFKINGREYYFNGDIRRIDGSEYFATNNTLDTTQLQEKVLVIDFMENKATNDLKIWEYQVQPDQDTSKVLGCIIEIADKALQFRTFKYIATLSSPLWRNTVHDLLQSICSPVTENVASSILSIISPRLQGPIDAGSFNLDIGNLSVNPSYRK